MKAKKHLHFQHVKKKSLIAPDCTYIILYSETQTFNWTNKKKNVWSEGDSNSTSNVYSEMWIWLGIWPEKCSIFILKGYTSRHKWALCYTSNKLEKFEPSLSLFQQQLLFSIRLKLSQTVKKLFFKSFSRTVKQTPCIHYICCIPYPYVILFICMVSVEDTNINIQESLCVDVTPGKSLWPPSLPPRHFFPLSSSLSCRHAEVRG